MVLHHTASPAVVLADLAATPAQSPASIPMAAFPAAAGLALAAAYAVRRKVGK